MRLRCLPCRKNLARPCSDEVVFQKSRCLLKTVQIDKCALKNSAYMAMPDPV